MSIALAHPLKRKKTSLWAALSLTRFWLYSRHSDGWNFLGYPSCWEVTSITAKRGEWWARERASVEGGGGLWPFCNLRYLCVCSGALQSDKFVTSLTWTDDVSQRSAGLAFRRRFSFLLILSLLLKSHTGKPIAINCNWLPSYCTDFSVPSHTVPEQYTVHGNT